MSAEQVARAVRALERHGITVTAQIRPDGYVEVAVTGSSLPTYPTHVEVARELLAERVDFFLRR